MYNARELADWAVNDPAKLWALPDGPIKIKFDDGVLETMSRPTIFSAYCWKFYSYYPETPALMCHHMRDQVLSGDTHLDLLGRVMFNAYDARIEKGHPAAIADIETMCHQVYKATNDIYNDFTYNLEAYVQTISILDFIEVVEHPEIKAANQNAQPNQISISQTYNTIKRVLHDPRAMITNPIARSAKSGQVSMGQILQCIGPRGFVTDIDSNIFRDPIMRGYVHGIRSIGDSLVESRSASKALISAETPLQKTEYFNRRLQLFAATVQNLHLGDCGSEVYLPWRVRSQDLRDLAGKYYRTDEGLKRFSTSDRHLIGEEIQMRSVLWCRHPDPQGVCSTCFGDLALSIPNETNLGHVCATALCEQASQSVLSTKHLDGSSTVEAIELSEYDRNFLRRGIADNTLKLSENLADKRVVLTISNKEAPHLSDVTYTDNVRNLQLTFISELTEIQLTITDHKGVSTPVILPVAVGTRKSSLSHAALEYIKQHSWTLTESANYAIDLKDWNNEEVLFELPLRHMNMLDYIRVIEVFIRATSASKASASSTTKNVKMTTLKDFDDPGAALKEFYAIVSSRLVVNIGHLEVLVLASMVRSGRDKDFSIPRFGNKVEFGSFNKIMQSRSLSAAVAFERQRDLLQDTDTYLIDHRMDHPMDALLFQGIYK